MKSKPTSQQLADQLTAEAGAQDPIFSASLHERIMDRIQNAPEAHAPLPISMRHWMILPTAIAAGVLLVAGVVFYMNQSGSRNAPPSRVVAVGELPSLPPIQNPVHMLDQPEITNWAPQRYASLDRDGKNLLDYMARQIDVVPQVRAEDLSFDIFLNPLPSLRLIRANQKHFLHRAGSGIQAFQPRRGWILDLKIRRCLAPPYLDPPGHNPAYMGAIFDDSVQNLIQSPHPAMLALDATELHNPIVQGIVDKSPGGYYLSPLLT